MIAGFFYISQYHCHININPMTDPNGAAIYGDMDPINIPPLC